MNILQKIISILWHDKSYYISNKNENNFHSELTNLFQGQAAIDNNISGKFKGRDRFMITTSYSFIAFGKGASDPAYIFGKTKPTSDNKTLVEITSRPNSKYLLLAIFFPVLLLWTLRQNPQHTWLIILLSGLIPILLLAHGRHYKISLKKRFLALTKLTPIDNKS